MSSTLLEVTRASHEEVERLERLVVKDLQNEPAPARDRLFQGHCVRNMISTSITTTEKLVDVYEDRDGARKDEIVALGGQNAANVFSAFYDRLKERHLGSATFVIHRSDQELMDEGLRSRHAVRV